MRFRLKAEVLKNGSTLYRAQWSPIPLIWFDAQRWNCSSITFSDSTSAEEWLKGMKGTGVIKTYIIK